MKVLTDLLHARSGPLTADLIQTPSRFGLGLLPASVKPDALATSVCGYCSTGCGLQLHLRDGNAIALSPAPDYPVNLGMACPKGWEALSALESSDRMLTPLLRDAKGAAKPISWSEAAAEFVRRFQGIQKRWGADRIACLSTGQIVTEEMALLGSLFRFGMQGVHYDSNTRQCMATSHVAYKQSLGFDAPPFTYSDFEESDVLVFIGSNLCTAHPILWQRVLRNRRQPQIIVIDPRATETAMGATFHLPIAPKSDLTLLYGTAAALLARGQIDERFIQDHTSGFSDFAAFVQSFTEAKVLEATRLPVASWHRFLDSLAPGKRISFWWTMGVNQSHEATRTAQAIINLALMTGNIGKPGTGPNSITGQCNAMGSRLFANATSLLGGRDFTNPTHRSEVAEVLGIDPTHIPSEKGWAYDQIIDGIHAGHIKGLWVIATNAVHSWIQQDRAREALSKLEFLVVQDLYHTTETAQLAHLLLPAAGWGEKEGTFINSERRIGHAKKVRRAPGQALSDFNIFRLIAEAWDAGDWRHRWSSPQAAFKLLRSLSRDRPCDFTGIQGYEMIDACGGIQWPWPDHVADSQTSTPRPETERRLFSDGAFFHPDQRARFLFDPPSPVPEPTDAQFPFTLLTGRGSSAQWHTLTRTAKSHILRQLSPQQVYIEINPSDARSLHIQSGAPIQVSSRRGSIVAQVVITAAVQPAQVFMPMHFPETNRLTLQCVDPHSRQPSYKHCAVRLHPILPNDPPIAS